MKHEEIIAMAREEGLSFVPDANSPLVRIVRKAVAKEREACAQVAEDEDHEVLVRGYYAQLGDARATMRNIAAAIRARGTKETA